MTVIKSQNDWPVVVAASPLLYVWTIPSRTGTFRLKLRRGSAGFLLAHFALWYADSIERVAGKVADDWGYAPMRYVRGSDESISNHSSGTAIDLNALQHPLGRVTLSPWKRIKIRARLWIYAGAIRGGLDYAHRKDEMHYEINKSLGFCETIARKMIGTDRGRKLLDANPTQRAVILS